MKIATVWMVLAGAGVAFAQPKDSKPAPKPEAPKMVPPAPAAPAKELDALKGWAKTWTCSGDNMAGEKVAPKITFKRELDNFAYSVKFEVPKTAKSPGFTGMGMFGSDGKNTVLTAWDNHGGMLSMKVKIDGEPATTMTWEGDSTGATGKVPSKITYSADGKKLTMTGEFAGKKAFSYECK